MQKSGEATLCWLLLLQNAMDNIALYPWMSWYNSSCFISTATPDAPDKPKLADADRDFILIEWIKPYDGGSPIKGYLVQKREAASKKEKTTQQAEWTTVTRNPVKVPSAHRGPYRHVRIVRKFEYSMFELSGYLYMQCLNRPGCTVWNIIIFIVYIKNQSQTKTLMSLVEPKLSCTPQLLCRAQRIVT